MFQNINTSANVRPAVRAALDEVSLCAQPVVPLVAAAAKGACAYNDGGAKPRAGQRAVALG
jgi:hypothetical protein